MEKEKFVLVTGGAGYVGSHVCKELQAQGFTPVVFDNLSTGHKDFVRWGPFVEGDLLNKDQIQNVFSKYKFESVLHFAAKAYVGESVSNPIKYYQQNIEATTNLLEIFLQKGIKSFVFSSSCATYGEPSVDFIDEKLHQDPINPYGFTKLASEKLITYLAEVSQFNYSILRYFNAAGADPTGEIGENHQDETHVIPLLLKAGLLDKSFRVFGNTFPTPDGTAIRDYVHVTDLAKAHVSALKINLEERKSLIVNLGSGHGISVKELVDAAKKLLPGLVVEIVEKRVGDPAQLVASPAEAQRVLGWKAKISDVETILSTALAWEKQQLSGLDAN